MIRSHLRRASKMQAQLLNRDWNAVIDGTREAPEIRFQNGAGLNGAPTLRQVAKGYVGRSQAAREGNEGD